MNNAIKKPELLAPAGNEQCLYAAINAGADAVYLAGKKFGARASADNFDTDSLVRAIDLAHLHNIKIYLTLNTLIKEREWDELYDFLSPLSEAGLDAVIIQDLGLIEYIRNNFPNIQIHASTQMTITGHFAADILKNMGVTRIVPARELTLKELINLKESTGIEIESFIHGAMCYCYSGQCFFSSYLGGRSGNRGRCAGPCRLPYTVVKDEKYIDKNNIMYPLSLKDMCTVESLDKLIDAGIDSFKIEGRLKSPEYVAGVTAIYRKYIDMYVDTGVLNVSAGDKDILKKLYIRTGLESGYYFRQNGKEMITLLNPSYSENDTEINAELTKEFVKPVKKLKITGVVTLVSGYPTSIILKYKKHFINCEGAVVDIARNQPLTKEDVIKQLYKTGDSFFEFEHLDVEMEDNCFMPVKSLNDLRRKAFEMLKEEIVRAKY